MAAVVGLTMKVTTNPRRGLGTKLAVFVAGVCVLTLFVAVVTVSPREPHDGSLLVIFSVFSLGLGSGLVAAALFSGLTPRRLVLDPNGITYLHGPFRKRLRWHDVTSVRALGVSFILEPYFAVVFDSGNRRVVAGSDFERRDLLKVVDFVRPLGQRFGFLVEDRE